MYCCFKKKSASTHPHLFEKAMQAFEQGHYRSAIQDFTFLLQSDPHDIFILRSRGEAKLKLNDFLGAIQDFNRSLLKEPKDPLTLCLRGEAYLSSNQPQKALDDLRESVQLSENNTAKNIQKANALLVEVGKKLNHTYVPLSANTSYEIPVHRQAWKDDDQPVVLSKVSTDQEKAKEEYNIGMRYTQEKNDAMALFWYQKAAKHGNAEAQFALGIIYAKGKGVMKDDAQAVSWYQEAAEQGNASAQYSLAISYAQGKGVEKNDAKAMFWYYKAADQGVDLAQFRLGLRYEEGRGVEKNDVQSAYWYRKAAEQGDSNGQFKLGLMYEEGRGVRKDDVQAVSWYRKAAEQGHPDAQKNLSVIYERSAGTKKNEAQVVSVYDNAVEANKQKLIERDGAILAMAIYLKQPVTFFDNALEKCGYNARRVDEGKIKVQAKRRQDLLEIADQKDTALKGYLEYNLGAVYAMQKDWGQAVVFLKKALDQGYGAQGYNEIKREYAVALYNLGLMYQNGAGIIKDEAQAELCFRKAAELGSVYASVLYNIGWRYEIGVGVIEDKEQAISFFRKAAELGNASAQQKLKELVPQTSLPLDSQRASLSPSKKSLYYEMPHVAQSSLQWDEKNYDVGRSRDPLVSKDHYEEVNFEENV